MNAPKHSVTISLELCLVMVNIMPVLFFQLVRLKNEACLLFNPNRCQIVMRKPSASDAMQSCTRSLQKCLGVFLNASNEVVG